MLRKILFSALLCAVLFPIEAQSLYDVVTSSTSGTFTSSGASVGTYTLEFRMVATGGLNPVIGAEDMVCQFNPGQAYSLQCFEWAESGGFVAFQMTNGTEYRVRYQHDAGVGRTTLTVWSGACKLLRTTNFTPGNVTALRMNTTWSIGGSAQMGFARLYTGLTGSGAGCPVDAPTTPADLFDFAFEDGVGAGGSLADRSGRGYTLTAPGATFVASMLYPPAASISGWTSPKPVFRAGEAFTLSSSLSRCFTYPGTGECSSYAWAPIAGPPADSMLRQTSASATYTPLVAGQHSFSLTIADGLNAIGTTSVDVGVVATDAKSIVQIPDAAFAAALSDGHGLLMHGASPWPWYEATEAADADLMSAPVAAPPHMVAGAGTVLVNVATGAVVGTGTDFSAADIGQWIEVTWDPDGDNSFSGRYVRYITSVSDSSHITLNTDVGDEPQGSFPAGLSWNRLAVGAGTCTLTASVSGGQVTGISGAASCSGFSWWRFVSFGDSQPRVALTLGGASGCDIKANILGPETTSDPTKYGTLDLTNPWSGTFPCGTGYTSAPTATVLPLNEYDPYDTAAASNFIYNYYEAGLGVGRLAARTGLASYQTEWHNFCTNVWRWSFDSGYRTNSIPRAAGYDMMVACATDPSWTPPGGANAMFAGIARMIGPDSVYFNTAVNPTSFAGVGLYDAREVAYLTRVTAKLCRFGGSYGLNQATWCGYLATQEANIWTKNLVNPTYAGSPDTTALYAPADLFVVAGGWRYPAAGNPPGSDKFGQSPWAGGGLLAIALTDAYDAFVAYGDTANAAIALNQVSLISNFIWNYGMSPNGGTFYDVGDASDYLSGNNTFNNYIPQPGYDPQSGYISVTNGSPTVTAACTNTSCANFLRRFWAGAQMQIENVNYTVASVDGTGNFLTLTTNYASSTHNTFQFGNTCAITVTNGSAAVTGSAGCKFRTFFGGGNAYAGIVSGACATGGSCALTDARVYAITPLTDTTATLTDHLTNTNVNFVGTSGTYTSFIYAAQTNTNCGASKSSYCIAGGRDLSQDIASTFGWLYLRTGDAVYLSKGDSLLNKIYGGSAGGSGSVGPPTGATINSRPGTVTTAQGSTHIVGVGTEFTRQFRRGGKIVVADGIIGGSWANPPGITPQYYTLTVADVQSDVNLTLEVPYPGVGSTATAVFYNPFDVEWLGADGGVGILGSMLPSCSYNLAPCGLFDFVPKYGKSFGMGPGAGNVPLYMAERVGGFAGAANRDLIVAFDLGGVPNAAGVTVSATNPDRTVGASTCSVSPCVVPIRAHEGIAMITIEYRSAAGKLLSTTTQQVVVKVP